MEQDRKVIVLIRMIKEHGRKVMELKRPLTGQNRNMSGKNGDVISIRVKPGMI